MAVRVQATTFASKQINALRGKEKTAYDRWLERLKHNGCAAMEYRMSGTGVQHLCVTHLRGEMRVIVQFSSRTHATILLIAEHDRSSPGDVYETLYTLGALDEPEKGRDKPPCCDSGGLPPIWDEAVDLAAEIDAVARRQRRRR